MVRKVKSASKRIQIQQGIVCYVAMLRRRHWDGRWIPMAVITKMRKPKVPCIFRKEIVEKKIKKS